MLKRGRRQAAMMFNSKIRSDWQHLRRTKNLRNSAARLPPTESEPGKCRVSSARAFPWVVGRVRQLPDCRGLLFSSRMEPRLGAWLSDPKIQKIVGQGTRQPHHRKRTQQKPGVLGASYSLDGTARLRPSPRHRWARRRKGGTSRDRGIPNPFHSYLPRVARDEL